MPRKDFLKKLDSELQHVDPRAKRSRTAMTDEDIPLDFKWDSNRVKLMKSRGVSGYVFSLARNPFKLEDALVRIKPVVRNMDALVKNNQVELAKSSITWLPEGFVLRSISIKKQLNNIEKAMSHPLTGSYTMAIGSYPSDVRAQLLAANFMNAAIDQQIAGQAGRGRAYPFWHSLMGSSWDPVRDSREPEPFSMLIIDNVGVDSSRVKLEKLRDLLVKFNHIPKIVIVNGIDPVTFFAEHVRLPLKYAFYLTAEQKASIMDI